MKAQIRAMQLALGTGAVVVLAAAVAWACTPQTRLMAPQVQKAVAGTAITIQGDSVTPGTPVAIHWSGLNGAQLAQAVAGQSGNFSATITVPQVAPGVYFVMAVPAGDAAVARVPFQVTGGASAEATGSTGLWEGFSAAGRQIDSAPASQGSTSPAGLGLGIVLMAAGLGVAAAAAVVMVRHRVRASA